jgi:murein DD-endopeptidase MepM/ murein hydrolase activator NlpD
VGAEYESNRRLETGEAASQPLSGAVTDSAQGSAPDALAPNRHAAAGGGLDEILDEDASTERPLDRELDRVGAPSAPASAKVVGRPSRGLSPNLVSVIGTLLGLTTVASLVALAIHIDPRDAPALALSVNPAEPQGSAAPSAAPAPVETKRARERIKGPWRIADAKDDPALRVVGGKIGRESFLKVVQDAGVDKAEAHRILLAMKGVRDLDKCNKNDTFSVLIERATKRVKAFEYVVSKEEVYQAKQNDKGLLEGSRLDLAVKHEQWSGAFAMDGDLVRSAQRGGFDPAIRETLAGALNGHLSVEDIEPGDVVRVVVQEVTVLGEFARYAGIEALEVRPKDGKKPLRIYYFRGTKERGYFNAIGQAPYEGGWRKPIPGAPVTSPFNLNRMHPVLKRRMPHTGVDFGCAAGVPIGAASAGKVTFKGWGGPAGNLVKIDHGNGIETGYAHMTRFADGLELGDRVKRLETVGYCGSTGRSTGPHLHFTAKKNGQYFDALKLNLDALRLIAKEERQAFEDAKTRYDALLDALPIPLLPQEALAAAPTKVNAGEEDMHGEEGDENAPATSAAPEGVAPPPAPAPAPARPAGGSAVHLTDEELLKQQGRSDDGEVEY